MINATPVSPVTPSTSTGMASASPTAAATATPTTPGRSTVPPSTPPVTPTPTGATPVPPPKKKGTNWKMVIGLVILLVVGIGAAAGFYLSQQTQEIAPRANTASCEWCAGDDQCFQSTGHGSSGDSSCSGSGGRCCIPRQAPAPTQAPQPTQAPSNTCFNGSPTASSCRGNTPGTACTGFPGTCVANGTAGNGQPVCGCVPTAPLPNGSSCTANANCQSGNCVNNVCSATAAPAPSPSPTPGTGGTPACTPGSATVAPNCGCGQCGCAAFQQSFRVCNQTGSGFTAECRTVASCATAPTPTASPTCTGPIGNACTTPSGAAGFCVTNTSGGNVCNVKRAIGVSCVVNGIPLNSACQSGRCENNVCIADTPTLLNCTSGCSNTNGCTCPAGCMRVGTIQSGQTCGGLAASNPSPTPSPSPSTCTPGTSTIAPGCNACGSCGCGSGQQSMRVCNSAGTGYTAQCQNSTACAVPTATPTAPANCSDGNGITVTSQADQARGACPYVITCNCNGTSKQHCAYGNIYSCSNVGAHCANQVCPAVGGAKVCEPGWISCLGDGTARGRICNMAGTGYYADPVNAHACGATSTCTYGCQAGTSGASCILEQIQCSAITPNPGAPAGTRFFDGCGTDPSRPDLPGRANCYNIANGSGGLNRSCVYEAGLSCGAAIGQPVISSPSPVPPGTTPPPQASPQVYSCGSACTSNAQCQGSNPGLTCSNGTCRLAANPSSPTCQPAVAGPQCLNITMTNVTGNRETVLPPQLGDTVRFTCGTVSGASRYIFRVIQPNGTVQMLQATGATSANYNIAQSGTYKAQCQICTGTADNTCHPFEAP